MEARRSQISALTKISIIIIVFSLIHLGEVREVIFKTTADFNVTLDPPQIKTHHSNLIRCLTGSISPECGFQRRNKARKKRNVQGSIMVKNEKKLSAAVGKNVTLLCHLMSTIDNIIQITWQKESGNFTGTVATTSKAYGQKILGYYSNRAKHSSVDVLSVSAITISPVTLEDEGCFKCIFNLFPIGASTGTTCLDVYEEKISEPTLDVEIIDFPETMEKLLVFTCVGSGLPPPIISWNLSLDLQCNPQMFSIVNPDGTVTVISNVTRPMLKTIERTEVTCVIHHPALGAEIRLSKQVPHTDEPPSNGDTIINGIINGRHNRSLVILPLAAVLILLLILISIISTRLYCLTRKSEFRNVRSNLLQQLTHG